MMLQKRRWLLLLTFGACLLCRKAAWCGRTQEAPTINSQGLVCLLSGRLFITAHQNNVTRRIHVRRLSERDRRLLLDPSPATVLLLWSWVLSLSLMKLLKLRMEMCLSMSVIRFLILSGRSSLKDLISCQLPLQMSLKHWRGGTGAGIVFVQTLEEGKTKGGMTFLTA